MWNVTAVVTSSVRWTTPAPSTSTVTPEVTSPLENPLIHFIFTFAYIFVFCATVLGNLLVLCVFATQKKMRTVTNFFLANLTAVDLAVGAFCVLQNAAHFVVFGHGRWPFGALMCHAYVYMLHLLPNVSAGILVLLSVERLVAVARPMRVRRLLTRRVLTASTALVWLGSAICNAPYVLASQHIEFPEGNETIAICTRRHVDIWGVNVLRAVSAMNLLIWYAIPLGALLAIYASIGVLLWRTTSLDSVARSASSRQQLLNGNGTMKNGDPPTYAVPRLIAASSTIAGSGESGTPMEGTHLVGSRRRVVRLAAAIVTSFAVLTLPRYIYIMWTVFRQNNAPRCLSCMGVLLHPISFLLLFLNSAINPFLYAFFSRRFRTAVADTFWCRRDIDKRRNKEIEMSSRRIFEKKIKKQSNVNYELDTVFESGGS